MPRSLPAHCFARLANTLRHSKAQYEYIADSHRASVRPTHNARKRAARLHLTVNVPKAAACPQTYVSLVPLPHIDDSIHPGSALVHAASEAIYPQVPVPETRRLPPIIIPDSRRSPPPGPELVSCFSAWSDGDGGVPNTDSSGGSFCSSALMTPPEQDQSYIVIRIKRKSITMLDESSDDEAIEKRPRYLRKDWSSRRI
ncbi:uncharacterized protein EV420DRAFT_1484508 [Desarmillaria tabescens]|uniref:Uncharacterized protein n=1 Tax=Armillaria tabescens TaxID=1929756 RepID=A0AA39JLW1_ARMTA|nr:uncharacterized protein EV420DRAFT_1484508 [Desarmillaria tabescens]KAK0444914.1 hypothetical protein EV420DRAFT_1484508 [Desarmillaria tabescens]